ncbi:MAG: hypothetical protein ACRDOH_02275 [Streptosporangiaceae bacterium]
MRAQPRRASPRGCLVPFDQQPERASIARAGPPDQVTVADVHASKCQPGVPRLPAHPAYDRQIRPPALRETGTDAERLALAGFLAGYRSLTREAYALDLRQFTAWCRARSLNLFAVRRADVESFARELEARGRAARP